MKPVSRIFLCATATLLALAAGPPTAVADPAGTSRYTFSWPLGEAAAPRGGTSRGQPVDVDPAPSAAWMALQEHGLTAFERDRRAILALAGDYRVTFDFLEIATFKPGTDRDRPYQSWGTERVYVDRDDGAYISLVHILDMRTVRDDGTVSEPMVTKHWREDWQYQPRQIVEFHGRLQYRRRRLGSREAIGVWSQAVDQVDESPRYAGLGRWEHSASCSTWLSSPTWRPLPRREASARNDYQVLAGTNRVTVTATGALQEENNLKMVLDETGSPDPELPYLAREYGTARYERLRGADFAAADAYYQRTRRFWSAVHDSWHGLFRESSVVTFRKPAANADPTQILFEHADAIAAGERPAASTEDIVRAALGAAGAAPKRVQSPSSDSR